MCKTRASFKLALRYCHVHKEQMQADACANSCADPDARKFWKNVSYMANSVATKAVNKIGDVVGDDSICEMWRKHFDSLYNSVPDDGSRRLFEERVAGIDSSYVKYISVQEVIDVIVGQKKNKSPGPNGLNMEAFMYGGLRLCTHMSLFYTFCIRHNFLPKSFMDITVVPLVKNKGGDLTNIDNYRAIAVSNVDTKILERIILPLVYTSTDVDSYQFGFKAAHSTTLCAGVLKQTVNYYVNRGSHVFACFVDFSKAFDRVNYWKLFNQLLDDDIPLCIVKLLAYWYYNQLATVCWHNCVSAPFAIGNGMKQGGVLSPYLFTRYTRHLLQTISSCGVGCRIGGLSVNILAYADDIVLLAPSWFALQEMLSLLEKCCKMLNLTCNSKKTVCVNFAPKERLRTVSQMFPCFELDGRVLQFVTEFCYLGHLITHNLSDEHDIGREIRKTYVRINILVRRFNRCSLPVKLRLFRSYCICFYGAALWRCHSKVVLRKLKSCYHKCLKKFFDYPKMHSITAILIELSLPSFDTIVHNCCCRFRQQWSTSCNRVVFNLYSLGLMF